MTLRELLNKARARLAPHFGEGESGWLVRIAMEHLKGYTQVDLALKADDEVTDWLAGQLGRVVDRLLDDEPIQYIFSEARFYGMHLKVTPATLIPRPETEELVDMIVGDYGDRTDLRVLDACTGSGCIAIALARNLPFAQVDAFDISDDALEVARENGRNLHADLRFRHADALSLPPSAGPDYDLIVSNPPYIAEHERSAMGDNVLRYEPPEALFVPDDDPLRFYKAIARYALTALLPGGRIYFEINPLFGSQLVAWMQREGWVDVSIELDIHRRQRFLKATKKK